MTNNRLASGEGWAADHIARLIQAIQDCFNHKKMKGSVLVHQNIWYGPETKLLTTMMEFNIPIELIR